MRRRGRSAKVGGRQWGLKQMLAGAALAGLLLGTAGCTGGEPLTEQTGQPTTQVIAPQPFQTQDPEKPLGDGEILYEEGVSPLRKEQEEVIHTYMTRAYACMGRLEEPDFSDLFTDETQALASQSAIALQIGTRTLIDGIDYTLTGYHYTLSCMQTGELEDGAVEVGAIETIVQNFTQLPGVDSERSGNFHHFVLEQVGGAWYTYLMAAPTLNSTYDFQLVNGYMVASDLVEAASTDLLYVIGSEKGNSLNKAQADVLFADGTRAVIDINKLENSTNNANNELTDGALYTYTRNSDSTYDVKLVTTSNKAGYDNYLATANNYTEGTNNANAKLGGYLIADDAVIFLKAGSGNNITYSVISGATLKTYASQNSTGVALLGTANGLAAVKVATMATAANFGTDSVYAYITSDPYTTLENGTTYYHYNAWTTDGEVTVKDNPTNGTPAKGNIITLVTKSDGTMSSDTIATVAANDTEVIVPVAITGFNGTDRTITMLDENGVKLGGDGLKYDANVQFLYVNTKDKVGLTGGEVALAEQLEDGTYVMNAYAIYSTETNSASFDALEAIVFDMNNDLNTEGNAGYVASVDNGTTATTIAATPTEPEGTITLSGTVKAGMPSDAAPTMGNIAIDQAKGNFAIVKITLPTELQGTSVAVRQTNAALGAYYDEDPSVEGNIKFKTGYDFSSTDKDYYLMLLEGGTATLEFDVAGCTGANDFVADYTYTINAAGLTLVTE